MYSLVYLPEAIIRLGTRSIRVYETIIDNFRYCDFWCQERLRGELWKIRLILILVITLLNWLPVQKTTMDLNTAVYVGYMPYAAETTVNLSLHQLLQGNVPLFKVLGYLNFTCGLIVRLNQFELTIIPCFLLLKLTFELLVF